MTFLRDLFLASAVSGMILGPGIVLAQEDESATDQAQFARGAQAWADHCGRCHNVRAPGELNDADWYVSTTHMRVRANLPGDVIEDIQAFLMASNKKK